MTTVEQEIVRLVKKLDAVTSEAALILLIAMLAGEDNLAALEASNAVLIAAGRKPVSVDDILLKIERDRHRQAD